MTRAPRGPVPSFSISVPVAAWHPLLPTCLASLVSQSADRRISVLDASSDPRVKDVVDRFAPHIAFRRHGPDGGQSDAIMEGWEHVDADLLGWLNADDFLYPGALARVAALFGADAATDVVTGHSAICDIEGRLTGYHWAVEAPGEALRRGCVISQPSCFFSRAAYEKAGGLDRALHYTMDWDLWLRMLASGAKFRFLPEPLSVVYWGAGTKTNSFNARRRAELERLIVAHTPKENRFRTRRGFFLRAALDGIGNPHLKRVLESALRRHAPSVFGIEPNGELGSRTELFWFHYDEAPKRDLIMSIAGADAVHVETSPSSMITGRTPREIHLSFDEPVSAGETVALTLLRGAGRRAALEHCGWA